MNKHIIKIAIAIIVAFALVCTIIYSFVPRKILNTTDDVRIEYIIYNYQFDIENADAKECRIELKGFEANKVIACLSKYKSCLTLNSNNGYAVKDSMLEVHINVNGKSKSVVLGNVNFESKGNGSLKRTILNPDKLLVELLEILDVSNSNIGKEVLN